MTVSAEGIASEHIQQFDRDGYTIIEDAFSPTFADGLVADLYRLELRLGIKPSTNTFEGRRTWRIYNLLNHGKAYQKIPLHPGVLEIVRHAMGEGALVSSLSSIAIGPGETAQPIHADDQIIPLPKPHPATVTNSMWALTDFTEANGATRIIPGTHVRDHSPEYGTDYPSIPAEMRKGSILVWHGSLWHGGGANTTNERRFGIAMNYCAGWVRQQENQQLGIPLRTLRTFEPALQELCGLGVYRGLIGHIDKKTPAERVLQGRAGSAMVWDRG